MGGTVLFSEDKRDDQIIGQCCPFSFIHWIWQKADSVIPSFFLSFNGFLKTDLVDNCYSVLRNSFLSLLRLDTERILIYNPPHKKGMTVT